MRVLDKGFIELVDCLGDDRTVVNAARVSFAKESAVFDEKDAKLIDYLAKNKHISPFYHPVLMFRIKAPISVQRQWFKHKVGTAENSESTRYVEVHEEFYIPEKFRAQSSSNKQGSNGILGEDVPVYPAVLTDLTHEQFPLRSTDVTGTAPRFPASLVQGYLQKEYYKAITASFKAYKLMVMAGVAKEQAREVLPLCTYTSWVWTASLAAVSHFLALRDHEHAQQEIRDYAKAMRVLTEPRFPASIKALDKYR